MDFSRSGNFPDSRSHRFCIAGINPCNPEFESLHRYPLSCASVSEKPCVQTRNHASPSTVLISIFLVSCAGSFLATFISLCTYSRTTTTLFQRHSLHICSQKNALMDGWVVNEIQTEIVANPYSHKNPRAHF